MLFILLLSSVFAGLNSTTSCKLQAPPSMFCRRLGERRRGVKWGAEWGVRGLRRLLALHPRVTFPACLPSPSGGPARFPPADLNASLAITHLRGAWCPSRKQTNRTKDHFAMIPQLLFARLACDFWPMTQLAVHVPAPSTRKKSNKKSCVCAVAFESRLDINHF